jgi:hypothetical protein
MKNLHQAHPGLKKRSTTRIGFVGIFFINDLSQVSATVARALLDKTI